MNVSSFDCKIDQWQYRRLGQTRVDLAKSMQFYLLSYFNTKAQGRYFARAWTESRPWDATVDNLKLLTSAWQTPNMAQERKW